MCEELWYAMWPYEVKAAGDDKCLDAVGMPTVETRKPTVIPVDNQACEETWEQLKARVKQACDMCGVAPPPCCEQGSELGEKQITLSGHNG